MLAPDQTKKRKYEIQVCESKFHILKRAVFVMNYLLDKYSGHKFLTPVKTLEILDKDKFDNYNHSVETMIKASEYECDYRERGRENYERTKKELEREFANNKDRPDFKSMGMDL